MNDLYENIKAAKTEQKRLDKNHHRDPEYHNLKRKQRI